MNNRQNCIVVLLISIMIFGLVTGCSKDEGHGILGIVCTCWARESDKKNSIPRQRGL